MTTTINADTSNGIKITSDTSGVMGLQTAGNTAVTIDGSQNVGIGTSSPGVKLDILSSTTSTSNTTLQAGISGDLPASGQATYTIADLYTNDNAGGTFDAKGVELRFSNRHHISGTFYNTSIVGFGASSATSALIFNTNSGSGLTERVRIDSSGNLVVGDTSSGRRFKTRFDSNTVYSSSDFDTTSLHYYLNNASSTIGAYTGIQFGVGSNGDAAISAIRTGDGESALAFGTRGGGVRGERVRIDSSGNLGIGTTSPAVKLDILNTNATYSLSQKIFNASAGTFRIGQSPAATFLSVDNFALAFCTNSDGGVAGTSIPTNERMRLDTSGSLLIATTTVPTTGGFPRPPLSIKQINDTSYGSGIQLEANADTSVLGIGYNGDTFQIGTSYRSTGGFKAISFSTSNVEAVRIDTSGSLLVGVTSGSYHTLAKNIGGNWSTEIRNSNANPYGLYLRFSGAAPNGSVNEFLYCGDTVGQKMAIRSNGGIANYSGSNVNLSDRREKTNFAPAKSYLDVICAIPVQTFNYIDQNMEDDGGLTLGVVAQDVQAVAPELVMESNWANKNEEPKMRLSIYQTDLQFALMKCIQEQQALITQLTARITALEGA